MIELIIVITAMIVVLFVVIYFPFFSIGNQLLGKVVYRKLTKEKLIALTFDDGPNEPYTSQILDILKKYNIKATFFPVGENIVRQKQILKRMSNENHVVGIHSYSHAFFSPFLSPSFKKEIASSQDVIINTIGKKPFLFRPPWLFRTPAMIKTAKKFGLTTISGSFGSYFEVFKVNPSKIAHDAINNTRPGTILIFHDGYNNKGTDRSKTVQALQIYIPAVQKLGYRFVTVPELIEQKNN